MKRARATATRCSPPDMRAATTYVRRRAGRRIAAAAPLPARCGFPRRIGPGSEGRRPPRAACRSADRALRAARARSGLPASQCRRAIGPDAGGRAQQRRLPEPDGPVISALAGVEPQAIGRDDRAAVRQRATFVVQFDRAASRGAGDARSGERGRPAPWIEASKDDRRSSTALKSASEE